MFKRCPHCNEVWVKVEGCDGETTCGNRPTKNNAKDSLSQPNYNRIIIYFKDKKALFERKEPIIYKK
jgi:hypothetical protein